MAPEHGTEPEGLLKSADLALYATKAQGRNDFQIYQPEMAGKRDPRSNWRKANCAMPSPNSNSNCTISR